MPQRRSLKSFILEIAVIVAMVGVCGHLGVRFWERYLIQSDLKELKSGLHNLKTALVDIDNVYDTLHTEIRDLKETVVTPVLDNNARDTWTLQDINVNTMIDAINKGISQLAGVNSKAVYFPSESHAKNPVQNAAKSEGLNFPSKANVKNEAASFLKANAKSESLNFPSKANVNNKAVSSSKVNAMNKTLNFPSKAHVRNEAFTLTSTYNATNTAHNFPSKADIKTEAHILMSKFNKATERECVETKSASGGPELLKLFRDSKTMTRYPLKSTGAGRCRTKDNHHKHSLSNVDNTGYDECQDCGCRLDCLSNWKT